MHMIFDNSKKKDSAVQKQAGSIFFLIWRLQKEID